MILCGVIVLIWMSVEDHSAVTVALLGTLLFQGILGAWLAPRLSFSPLTLLRRVLLAGLLGLMGGAGAVITTVALMFFKTAWHAHGFPDYPVGMMADMFSRLPVWSIAGALIGVALVLFHAVRQPD